MDITATYGRVTGRLRITIPPAVTYTIKGTAIDSSTGGLVPAASVDAGGGHSTTTDTAGQFVLTGISAGPVLLTAAEAGYVTLTQTLSVLGDMTITVRLSKATPCDTLGFDELQVNMAPFIEFQSPAGTTTEGEVVVTGNLGMPFKFLSVDLFSSTTPIPYVITGSLNSVQVFSFRNTQGDTFGGFATIGNPTSGTSIDTLVIHLSNPSAACCSNPMGLDTSARRSETTRR